MRLKYDLCYNISSMIADIHITEKSFGDKTLMKDVKFSVDDGEKAPIARVLGQKHGARGDALVLVEFGELHVLSHEEGE